MSSASNSLAADNNTSDGYSCSACQVAFPTGDKHRSHMKEPWHVYNIKRRIASMPPIPQDAFLEQVEKTETVATTPPTPAQSSNSAKDEVSPLQCPFCSQSFDTLAHNVGHMSSHGLFIPDPDRLLDMECFVGYLATEVREWHECIYCGATKPSTFAIQSHMRDKGHCQLNFDREPELMEFWDELEPAEPLQHLSASEIRLSSKLVESRHTTRTESRRRAEPLTIISAAVKDAGSPPHDTRPPPPSQLAHREMGILGISVQQRQALVLAEKKAQRNEAVAVRAREWIHAKGANSQKYDQLDNRAKWGKQQHKLLPR